MFRLVILQCAILAIFDITRFVWIAADEAPNQAYTTLMAEPETTIETPHSNGYFLLLGFTAPPTTDPVQAGYEMWLESKSSHGPFDYARDGRSHLTLPTEVLDALLASDVQQLLATQARPDRTLPEGAVFETRYTRWLEMPFDDQGYGQPATPRAAEIFVAHRHYLSMGLKGGLARLLERLERDAGAWRAVLRTARTVSMKVLAAAIVDDDMRLLSAVITQHSLEESPAQRLTRIAQPLNEAEASLRWPMQHEFWVGAQRYASSATPDVSSDPDEFAHRG